MAHQAVDSWAQHLRRTAEALLGLHQQGKEQRLLLTQLTEELEEKRRLLVQESALLEATKADLIAREERLKISQDSPKDDAAESSSAVAIRANLQRVLVAAPIAQKKSEAPLAQVEELRCRVTTLQEDALKERERFSAESSERALVHQQALGQAE